MDGRQPPDVDRFRGLPDWFQTLGRGAWLLVGIAALLAITFLLLGVISDLLVPLVFAAILAAIFVPLVSWADEFYLRSHHRSAALLDPSTIETPRIHWSGT